MCMVVGSLGKNWYNRGEKEGGREKNNNIYEVFDRQAGWLACPNGYKRKKNVCRTLL